MCTLWAYIGAIGGCIGLICSPSDAMQNYCRSYDETKHKMIHIKFLANTCTAFSEPFPLHIIYTPSLSQQQNQYYHNAIVVA